MTKTTKTQVAQTRDASGKITGGMPPVGFHTNPENIGKGFWKITDTPRAKLEVMMKLNEEDLKAVAENKDAPLFERKLAIAIKNSDWKVIDAMINQVYGQAKQAVDITSNGQEIKSISIESIIEEINDKWHNPKNSNKDKQK